MKRSKKSISRERSEVLAEFQKYISVRFKDPVLLNTALSHKSYVNEVDPGLENNEKLEFLGDALLGFIISDLLYNQNLYFKEGTLARIKSYVVSEAILYKVGKEMNIQKYILIGKGEEKSGGRQRKALISDSVEAVIGAYLLDAGFHQARNLVERFFYKEIIEVEKNRHEKDYKSILQEYAQKKYRIVPGYSVVNTKGPDHKREFFVTVSIKKKTFGPGIGESKKQAEQKAASIALIELKKIKGLRDPNIEKLNKEEATHKIKKAGRFVRKGKRSKNSSKDAGA